MCSLDARARLTSTRNNLQAGTSSAGWANRSWRTSHALSNLGRIHAELGECAAERIAVHAKLFSSLALITAVTRKNLEDVLLFKLAHRVGVGNTSGVHLEDEVVEFAFQSRSLPFMELTAPLLGPARCFLHSVQLTALLDPAR
jgi:hypothetical protein